MDLIKWCKYERVLSVSVLQLDDENVLFYFFSVNLLNGAVSYYILP